MMGDRHCIMYNSLHERDLQNIGGLIGSAHPQTLEKNLLVGNAFLCVLCKLWLNDFTPIMCADVCGERIFV